MDGGQGQNEPAGAPAPTRGFSVLVTLFSTCNFTNLSTAIND